MRILLGISILVLVALLGTTFSIVRHIRVTRRRNRFLREQEALEDLPMSMPLPSIGNIAPLPARFAAPILPLAPHDAIQSSTEDHPATVIVPQLSPQLSPQPTTIAGTFSLRPPVIAPENPTASPLSLLAAARLLSRDLPQPSLRTSLHPQAETDPKPAAEAQPLRILEFVPTPSATDISPKIPAFSSPAPAKPEGKLRQLRPVASAEGEPSAKDTPPFRRPIRSVQAPPQPASNGPQPSRRTDWMYFNKDMGDLSDPLPGRIRDRVRLRSR